MSGLLDELLRDRDGQRVLLVGHAATRSALDHLLTGRPLEAAVTRPFAWREGWTYELSDVRPWWQRLDGEQAAASAAELTEVYRAAFSAPGYDESEASVERFRDRAAAHPHRRATGSGASRWPSATGWPGSATATRVSWTSGGAARSPSRRPATLVDEWLGGHFEFVELAVDPRWQGRGFATALHDALLLGLPQDRALLTTYRDDRPAPRLYRRLGLVPAARRRFRRQ